MILSSQTGPAEYATRLLACLPTLGHHPSDAPFTHNSISITLGNGPRWKTEDSSVRQLLRGYPVVYKRKHLCLRLTPEATLFPCGPPFTCAGATARGMPISAQCAGGSFRRGDRSNPRTCASRRRAAEKLSARANSLPA